MKSKLKNKILLVTAFSLFSAGCSVTSKKLADSAPGTLGGTAALNSGIPGSGNSSIRTSEAVVSRINQTLSAYNVSTFNNNSNCATAMNQVSSNLPQNTDPLNVSNSAIGQISPLTFACCVDVSMTAANLTSFGLNTSKTLQQNSAMLAAAGVKILDAFMAGQASANSSVYTPIFNTEVTQLVTAGATLQSAFASVCATALYAGVTLVP